MNVDTGEWAAVRAEVTAHGRRIAAISRALSAAGEAAGRPDLAAMLRPDLALLPGGRRGGRHAGRRGRLRSVDGGAR